MSSDRLSDDERNQIRDHRPSCPCDLCQRHRNEIGIGTERERLILEQCEQVVGDRLSDRLYPVEFITATEIERARGSLNPTQWQQEYLAELPSTPQPPPRRSGEIRLTIQLSEETSQRIREAFEGFHRSLEQLSSAAEQACEPVRQFAQSDFGSAVMRGVAQFHAHNTYTAEPVRHPDSDIPRYAFHPRHRYGKSMAQQGAQIKAWCEQNGYTEPFSQEGEWWAFPPSGVMPVQLADVMGEGRSPF